MSIIEIDARIIFKLYRTHFDTLNQNIEKNKQRRRKNYITKRSSKNSAHNSTPPKRS